MNKSSITNGCRTLNDILSGSNRVKICRAISLPHTSRYLVPTNHVEAWGRVIQNQDGAYSTDAAKIETCFVYLDFSTVACEQAPKWGKGRKEKSASRASGARYGAGIMFQRKLADENGNY